MLGQPQRTAEQIRLLQSLRENDSIRAVVIDIDSGGGTVSASDYLHRSVQKLVEKKPVIAFMRGTAASGGYMVGCAASKSSPCRRRLSAQSASSPCARSSTNARQDWRAHGR